MPVCGPVVAEFYPVDATCCPLCSARAQARVARATLLRTNSACSRNFTGLCGLQRLAASAGRLRFERNNQREQLGGLGRYGLPRYPQIVGAQFAADCIPNLAELTASPGRAGVSCCGHFAFFLTEVQV